LKRSVEDCVPFAAKEREELGVSREPSRCALLTLLDLDGGIPLRAFIGKFLALACATRSRTTPGVP
jgi:hypothetical protein